MDNMLSGLVLAGYIVLVGVATALFFVSFVRWL